MPKTKKKNEKLKRLENKQLHAQKREDESFREVERERDREYHQKSRLDPLRRSEEQELDTMAHQKARKDPERRKQEQEINTLAHRLTRQNSQRQSEEQARNTRAHQLARENPERRQKEQESDKVAHQVARLNVHKRTPEKERDQVARAVRRSDPVKRKADTVISVASTAKRRRLFTENCFADLALQFTEAIRESPCNVCVCCGLLNYKTNIGSHLHLEEEMIAERTSVTNVPVQFCKQCIAQISKGKVPKLSLANGLNYFTMPDELKNLTALEERLLALRIPFMQIRPVGYIRELKLKGTVVNVENDLSITTKAIPRSFDETSTVLIYLMRKMQYNTPYMAENVRPAALVKAAEYLVKQELYTTYNIGINPEWKENSNETVSFILNGNVNQSFITSPEATTFANAEENMNRVTVEQNSVLDEPYDNVGAEESLIFSSENLSALKIAPGEGKRPIPLYQDKYVEEMTFIRCYTGRPRPPQPYQQLSYTDIKKSELLRYDRRGCTPTHVLFAMRMSFENQLNEAFQMFLRKQRGEKVYTAREALQPDFNSKLIRNDEGYAVWKNLRSSPSYWQSKQKHAIAMVRQEGPCTFFLTLSAAETHWNPLLVSLIKIAKNIDISEDEASSLSNEEKAKLIRDDPVTCMRHFNHRYQKLWTLIFKRQNGLFAPYELKDYFNRMEFQMRGSPHIHALLWLKNAPLYEEGNQESEGKCIEFIDQFITVKRDEEGEMKELLPRQVHKHATTCYKHSGSVKECRFGYPLPPLPQTMFLHPLPAVTSPKEIEKLRKIFKAIKAKLIENGRNPEENPTFMEFLTQFHFQGRSVSEQEYYLAIRSSLKRVTLFHRREVNAAYINRYNRDLLILWKANIDIQFVTDTYACARYCVSYVFKCDGGMSKLMRVAAEQAKSGHLGNKEELKKYSRVLRDGSEVSPQEASGFLLQIKNTDSSRTDVFVNTGRPEERTVILKSNKELEELPHTSTEIFQKGILHKYSQRPDELEDICLADFATTYEYEKAHEDDEPVETTPTSSRKKQRLRLRDGSGFVHSRPRKILRFRHFKEAEDPVNYWREQLMLFVPWRDEESELLSISSTDEAAKQMDIILTNSEPYFFNRQITDNSIRDLITEIQETEDEPADGCFENLEEDGEYLAETLVEGLDDIQIATGVEQFLPPPMLPEEDYLSTMRKLNLKQQKFVLQTLRKIKQNETFHYFLHGGAGVGKSLCITAIVQSVLRYYKTIPEFDFSKAPVVVTAFTGKAAFNVYGMTLHCCFNLPVNEYHGAIDSLGESALNSLRSKLFNLKLIVIDEISMVSVRQLYQIDKRLRQIFNTNLDFGGRSVLIVGHLRQLTPIAGRPPFDIPRHLQRGELLGNILWELFGFYELEEIMRQQGDDLFCKALNNLSEGCMDENDIDLIRSRCVTVTGQPPFDTINLFQTNDQCSAHNEWVHSQLNTDGILCIAADKIEGTCSQNKKLEILERAKNLRISDTEGLRYQTYLKVEGWYFVSTNIDVSDGLFNGSTGVLKYIERKPLEDGREVFHRAWIKFPDPLTGKERRKKCRALINLKCKSLGKAFEDYTPIDLITKRLLNKNQDQTCTLIRRQIPLVACNGMTIAKSQGSTMSSVVVCTGGNSTRRYKRKISIQELYVACSRVTSLKGLYINGEFEPPSLPGPDKYAKDGETRDMVTIELEELRSKPINFDIPFFYNYDENVFKLYFHNVQSFQLHREDLIADFSAMNADVIALVEPHLLEADLVNVPGFLIAQRENCKLRRNGKLVRNSEGLLLLTKVGTSNELNGTFQPLEENGGHCFFHDFVANEIFFTLMYRSSKYPQARFKQELELRLQQSKENHVFIGDINMDLMNKQHFNVISIFGNNGFTSLLDLTASTTNAGTHIDVCFSNNFEHAAFISESYYSHHKPIGFVFLNI